MCEKKDIKKPPYLHKFKVDTIGLPCPTYVYFDDVKLENVTEIDYHISVHEIPTATITLNRCDFEALSELYVNYTADTVESALKIIAGQLKQFDKVSELDSTEFWQKLCEESKDEEIKRMLKRISEIAGEIND